MSGTAHTLSVALVTRNRPESLRRALESWRAQTVAPAEIVIADDSDPEYAPAVALLAGEFGCVYVSGPRRGLYANRNCAAGHARGTHIVSADDDHTYPADYVATIMELVAHDPHRVWIFTLRNPARPDAPLECPPELHRSGVGQAPADPTHCAAISDGASVFPRAIFDSGLRYDEAYGFGGMWYLWGKVLARAGWRITYCDRAYAWHHGTDDLEQRFSSRRALQQQLTATTYVQFVNALWLDRSPRRAVESAAYTLLRLVRAESAAGFTLRARLPLAGAVAALWRALSARPRYRMASGYVTSPHEWSTSN
jgi:glycosyltransferase involved in cell wall biosynthesis